MESAANATSSEPGSERVPAVIVLAGRTSALRVAALSLLDRLLVMAHRAGCGPLTVVATDPLPPLRRARAWKIPFEVVATPPVLATRALLLRTEAVVDKADLRRLLETPVPTRLVTTSGDALPAATVAPGTRLDETAGSAGPTLVARGVSYPVTDAASARVAERGLWASLTSSSDGTVDRWFNRPMGRPLSKLLIHTPVTPNAVSVASILIGVFAAYLFTSGDYGAGILAALVFQLSAIVDCVDGDVARAVYKETPMGKWLDLVGDQVVHASVFAGLAWGVAQDGGAVGVTVGLGISAVLGGLIAFAVVLWGMLHPRTGAADGDLQRVLDAATNRDFSVLVLALALADRLEWFLWMAAIGSHLFWMLLVGLRLRGRKSERGAA